MLCDGISVGHARDVITNRPVQAKLSDLFVCLNTDGLWVLHVVIEKVLQQLPRADVRLVDDVVEVEIFVEILPQFDVQLAPLRAVLDERFRMATYIVG